MTTRIHIVVIGALCSAVVGCGNPPGGVDAGSAVDAGVDDATIANDAPSNVDAGSAVDAATVDALVASDAPVNLDASPSADATPLDAVAADDAPANVDADLTPDASPPADAGPPPDALTGDTASPDYFDVVLDTTRHQVFLSYRDARRVEVLSLSAGLVAAVDTAWFAEHMYFDAARDEVVISLPVADHSPFWWNADQEGYVGVIDATAPNAPVPFYIPRDPWQIVADGMGFAYVAGGSGQNTQAVSIELTTATWDLTSGFRASSSIRIHPNADRFYSATGGAVPNTLGRWDISSGAITFVYDSVDDNEHDVCGDLRIHPWGHRIFTRCGEVFTAADTQTADMRWVGTIGSAWDDLAFDPTGAFAYVLVEGNDTLGVVDAQTLATVATVPIGDGVRRILTGTDYLVLIRDVVEVSGPRVRADVLPYSALLVDIDSACSSAVTVTPPGTVCDDDCAELYATGTAVTLTASVAASESFVGWTGPCAGTGACMVSMDAAQIVGAVFTGPTESLDVAIAGPGSGTVISDRPGIDCPTTCTAGFVRDCEIELSAVPDPSSSFTGWSGDCTGTGACLVPMSTAASVTATFASHGDALWVVRAGGSNSEELMGVAVDGSDNVISAGVYSGNPNFGDGPLPNAGQADFFVAKFLADSTLAWAAGNGTTNSDRAWEVAVDASGDVFVAGYYDGTLSFAGADYTSSMWADFFVAKYAADGTELWFRSFGGPRHDDAELRLAVDSSGDVIVVGAFKEAVDFGAGSVVANDSSDADVFIAKYDGEDGAYLWAIHYGPIRWVPRIVAVGVDAAGDIIVSSTYRGTVDFGGASPLTSQQNDDMFIAKYAGSDGAHMWSISVGGQGDPLVAALAIDSAGDVVVTGAFHDPIDFGGGTISLPDWGTFVARYDGATGAYAGALTHLGGNPFDMAVDSAGDAVVVGYLSLTVDFGGGPLTTAGEGDIYVVEYDVNGHEWSKRFGGVESDWATSVALNSAGNLIVGATFKDTIDIDGTPYVSAGNQDVLILQLQP